MLRIHTLFIIQKTFTEVSDKFLNEKLCAYLYKLAEDPVPNIKFNVAKSIEMMYKKINNTNKMKCQDILRKMEQSDLDFDVKYYAQKAIKTI